MWGKGSFSTLRLNYFSNEYFIIGFTGPTVCLCSLIIHSIIVCYFSGFFLHFCIAHMFILNELLLSFWWLSFVHRHDCLRYSWILRGCLYNLCKGNESPYLNPSSSAPIPIISAHSPYFFNFHTKHRSGFLFLFLKYIFRLKYCLSCPYFLVLFFFYWRQLNNFSFFFNFISTWPVGGRFFWSCYLLPSLPLNSAKHVSLREITVDCSVAFFFFLPDLARVNSKKYEIY